MASNSGSCPWLAAELSITDSEPIQALVAVNGNGAILIRLGTGTTWKLAPDDVEGALLAGRLAGPPHRRACHGLR